jgi:arylsulfatase A-like enzyme
MKALEDSGQAENTIVIYSSDHGEMMGSSGWMGKRLPHDESCHVPFFARVPGVTQPGSKSDILFAAVDIYPTLCGLAGIPAPKHCAGKDLSAVMRGKNIPSPDAVYLMNITKRGEREGHPPDFRGIRTQTHTYAVAEDGRWCLYDNGKDAYQIKNLVADDDLKPLMAQLDAQIAAWLRSANDPFRLADATRKISPFPVRDNKLSKKFDRGQGADTD